MLLTGPAASAAAALIIILAAARLTALASRLGMSFRIAVPAAALAATLAAATAPAAACITDRMAMRAERTLVRPAAMFMGASGVTARSVLVALFMVMPGLSMMVGSRFMMGGRFTVGQAA